MAQQKIYHSASCINLEELGQIAILMHQSNVLHLEISLWTSYYRSGTGTLKPNESNLKVWPTCVKSMIQSCERKTTISDISQIQVNDDKCFKFVSEHLSDLNEKEQQSQQQLSLKKKQFYGYSFTIEETLQTFIQEHMQPLYNQYEYDIAMIKYEYQEGVLNTDFHQQNPNEQQVTNPY